MLLHFFRGGRECNQTDRREAMAQRVLQLQRRANKKPQEKRKKYFFISLS